MGRLKRFAKRIDKSLEGQIGEEARKKRGELRITRIKRKAKEEALKARIRRSRRQGKPQRRDMFSGTLSTGFGDALLGGQLGGRPRKKKRKKKKKQRFIVVRA